MCGQLRFDVRDNVATFVGQVEVCCLPTMEIAPAVVCSDTADKLRKHMTGIVRAYLRDRQYRTGEGRMTVTNVNGLFGQYRIQATLFAEGPDADLHIPAYTWAGAIRRSAGS